MSEAKPWRKQKQRQNKQTNIKHAVAFLWLIGLSHLSTFPCIWEITHIVSHSQLFYKIYHINLDLIEEKDQKIHNVSPSHLIKKSVNARYLLWISLNALHVLILLIFTHKNVENIIVLLSLLYRKSWGQQRLNLTKVSLLVAGIGFKFRRADSKVCFLYQGSHGSHMT